MSSFSTGIEMISNYVVVKVLYKNQNSEVVIAYRHNPDQKYIIKSIKHAYPIDLQRIFYSEINACAFLDHPNIAKPVDVQITKDALSIIYNYESGSTLHQMLATKHSFSEIDSLTIARQIVSALSYIHARGIIHADLNPHTLFITLDNKIKLLDFGYSLTKEDADSIPEGQILGTFPYLSIEQTGFSGFKIDSRTDLFCASIILYQCLAGALPFPVDDCSLKEYLNAIIKRAVSGIKHIPHYLNGIVLKGLRPTPADRYQTAEGMLHDIAIAVEKLKGHDELNIDIGKKDVLLAINRKRMFVVRDNELNLLNNGLSRLIKGTGTSYLIYGKSGIGKTELVREFKKSISEKDIMFLTAKSNRFTPSQPYYIYRQILLEFFRKLTGRGQDTINEVKKTITTELFEYSGLICQIVPEMEKWFTKIGDIEEIEKDKEHDRIISVLTNVISKLCLVSTIVVYIDDFQWTDKISTEIVLKLVELKKACLLLCNFRTNELDQDVYAYGFNLLNVGFDTLIAIREFSQEDTGKLLSNKLGPVRGLERLTDVLYQKTDGVPYVLNEAIRYLVNEEIVTPNGIEWEYNNDTIALLPDKFDPVALILRKVDTLEDDEKQLLQTVSLIEGKFDERLIDKLTAKKSINTLQAISRFETKGFITAHLMGGYTFAHDRIQESIANDVVKADKLAIHNELGALYYEMSKSDKRFLFNAAEHYLKSSNMVSAFITCYEAAVFAQENTVYDIAIKYFKNVVLLSESKAINDNSIPASITQIKLLLGDVLLLTGANEQALAIFDQIMNNAAIDTIDKLETEYKIGTIYHNIGEFEMSSKYFIQSLETIGLKLPKKRIAIFVSIVYEMIFQMVLSGIRTRLSGKKTGRIPLMKVKIVNKLAYSLYFSDMIRGYNVHFIALNLADRLADCSEKAETYTLHQIPIFQVLMKKRAFRYNNKAKSISQRIKRKDTLAFAESFGGLIYYYNACWNKSESALKRSISLYNSIGDVNNQIVSSEHLWKLLYLKGSMPATIDAMNETIELCKKVKEKYYVLVTMSARNLCHYIKTGIFNVEEYHEIQRRLLTVKSLLFHIETGGYLLDTEIKSGNYPCAYKRAVTLLPLIIRKCINSEYQVRCFSLFCSLICNELRNRTHGEISLPVKSKKLILLFVLNSIVHFVSCFSFPAYWGSFYRNSAWFFALIKIRWASTCFFKKALRAHHTLDMKYEEACTYRDYAIFLDDFCDIPGDARDYRSKAYELFKWCGSKLDMCQLENSILQNQSPMKHCSETLPEPEPLFDVGSSSAVNLLRFDTLADVSKTITETDNPSILLKQILSAMITATGAQYGYLYINKNMYSGYAPLAMSFEGNDVAVADVPIFKDLIDKVNDIHTMQGTKESLLDDENETDSKFIRSDLCVPLNWRDKYLGYVYLVNDRVRGLFGEGAQKSALILAAHAGILLENANLMSKQKEFNEALQQQVRTQTKDIVNKHRQLEEANLKLIESERMKGILSGTLVHDIKNYAAGINGNLTFLQRRIGNDPKVQHIIDVVCETCADITSLASNLLDIAKMDDGKMIVREEMLDYQFFEAMAEKFGTSTLFEEKEIVPHVIPPQENFVVSADTYLMERVMQNLYSNAAKYGPKSSKVELYFDIDEKEVAICFFNSGKPIPDNEKQIVFEKYARLHNYPSYYSKGLGLFFCKMVMTAHGGRIWLDTDNSGNHFKFALPRKNLVGRILAAS